MLMLPNGEYTVRPETLARGVKQAQADDAILAFERGLEVLARARLFTPEAIAKQAMPDRLGALAPGRTGLHRVPGGGARRREARATPRAGHGRRCVMTGGVVTVIDQIVAAAITQVVEDTAARGYFRRNEIVDLVLDQARVQRVLRMAHREAPGWELDEFIVRGIKRTISTQLQTKDANGIRVYESYLAENEQRRYQRFRGMTAARIRLLAQTRREQERRAGVIAQRYEMFLEELERLPAGAVVDDVYERVVERMRAARRTAGP